MHNKAAKVRDSIQAAFESIREAATARERELLALVEEKCGEIEEDYTEFTQRINDALGPDGVEGSRTSLESLDDSDISSSLSAMREGKEAVSSAKELCAEWEVFQSRDDNIEFVGSGAVESVLSTVKSFKGVNTTKEYKGPKDLKVIHAGSSTVVLSWSLVPGVKRYAVFKKVGYAQDFMDNPAWEGTTGQCMITGLSPTTDYGFCVKGVYGEKVMRSPSEVAKARTTSSKFAKVADLSTDMKTPITAAKSLKSLCESISSKGSTNTPHTYRAQSH